ncbi:UDP-N-acetylmuramate dehydrogenase [Salicibibacter halophilus]|uniref:UDP-N-acetylenolpyruvoylglucosamine reductase n=1 Tax=Salicibibacter halophilus TaxID=2502791 RepID=A0A514LKN3_9BACI|nr:UDP-N-acetylmuramate dehydrogenase [Salicibibacter halophilus]QDI92409.1 UDP-N-acetylmuramate dehydrogenase [Salicibibacter halophilus]
MSDDKLYETLKLSLPSDRIRRNESLDKYTHTKTGGKADYLVLPNTYEEASAVTAIAYETGVPLTMLGNGSNLIIRDGGIRGIVLHFNRLNKITVQGNTITAQSGAAIIDVSRTALNQTLTGIEFACGIPGSVGGALVMNAGAYGGEVSHVLVNATLLTKDGEIITLKNEELELSYRSSIISKKDFIVLEAVFALEPGKYHAIKAMMDELTYLRESKQPLEFPSCGSVFKRPPNHFAGKLIQDSGLQKARIGGAEVSGKHAGFIVNVDGATATDYLSLINHIQRTVKKKFGVHLHTEVKIIGED